MGNVGSGKTSFIQQLVHPLKIQNSLDQEGGEFTCKQYTTHHGNTIVETPGMNCYFQKSDNEILFMIVQQLKQNNYFDRLFIIFMDTVELFGDDISQKMIDTLLQDFKDSQKYLNTKTGSITQPSQPFYKQKIKLLQKREEILNQIDKFMNYHIVVTNFIDDEVFGEISSKITENAYQQLWSSMPYEGTYKYHISNQERYLFQKIEQIIKKEEYRELLFNNLEVQYILLIGHSQVGKSHLIEQLLGIKGLKGESMNNCTQYCKIHFIEHEGTIYGLIDTPGISDQRNQSQEQQLLVILDYLKRKGIFRFRPIFFKQRRIKKDNQTRVLFKDLILLIVRYFSLHDKWPQDQRFHFEEQIDMLSSKFLLVNLDHISNIYEFLQEQDHYQIKLKSELNKNELNVYCETNGTRKLKQEINQFQTNLFFSAINNSQEISIFDNFFPIRKKNFECAVVIEDNSDFSQIFEALFILCQQYLKVSEYSNINNKQQSRAGMEIDRKIYLVMSNKWNDIKLFLDYKSRNELFDLQTISKIQIMMYRRFLVIGFQPVLFECDENSPNVLISRQQINYKKLKHFLRDFENLNNQFYFNLSAQLVREELIQKWEIYQNLIDVHQNKNDFNLVQENIQIVLSYCSQMNGLRATRNSHFFNSFTSSLFILLEKIQSKYNLPMSKTSKSYLGSNIYFSIFSAGYEILSQYEGKVGKENFLLEYLCNPFGFFTEKSLLIPELGIPLAMHAMSTEMMAFFQTNEKYISPKELNSSTRLFFMDFLNDNLSNQVIMLFERRLFLKNRFKIDQIYNFDSAPYNQAYRTLEEVKEKEKQQLLSKLHKSSKSKEMDLPASYIMNRFILNKMSFLPEEKQINERKSFKKQIDEIITINQTISDQFLRAFKDPILSELTNQNAQIIKLTTLFVGQYQQIQEKYNFTLQKLKQKVEQTQTTYIQLSSICEQGYFSNRFNQFIETYYNFMNEKVDFLFSQPVINSIIKNDSTKTFSIRPGSDYKSVLIRSQSSEYQMLNYVLINEYISSRYLHRSKGSIDYEFNSLNSSEVLNDNIEQSIDLYSIAKKVNTLLNFKKVIEEKIVEMEIEKQRVIQNRAKIFYKGFLYLINIK